MATLKHKNPCPVGHEIYNFGRSLPDPSYFIHNFSDSYPGVEKNYF